MLSVILLSMLMILLCSTCDQASDVWTWIWSTRHCGLGKRWLVDFNAGKTHLVLFDKSNSTGAIGVKLDRSVLEEKLWFKMLGLTFSSKLDWCSYIIFNAKTASKKIGALIHSMKFLSPEVALYLYKTTIQPCVEYHCYVWVGASGWYLELLDKL